MSTKSFLISLLLLCALRLAASGPQRLPAPSPDEVSRPVAEEGAQLADTLPPSLPAERVKGFWESLAPSHAVVQYAGSIGFMSAGIGWTYGKARRWETEVLLGATPRFENNRAQLTLTFREHFVPWQVPLKNKKLSLEPLTASLWASGVVYGSGKFWTRQPRHIYGGSYYHFFSSRWRLGLSLGQRFGYSLTGRQRRFGERLSLYYELGTCDLYILCAMRDSRITLLDALSLSFGLKWDF